MFHRGPALDRAAGEVVLNDIGRGGIRGAGIFVLG